jgi:hypothetical protein
LHSGKIFAQQPVIISARRRNKMADYYINVILDEAKKAKIN